jgi:DNA-binding transcriptional MerR regulator
MADRSQEGLTRLKIGAVARLTGLSVHTLRKWEERYQAVQPARTESGERLYTREDVRRLVLLKRLMAAGVPLGDVAHRSLEGLERASHDLAQDAAVAPSSLTTAARGRVAVAGETLPNVLALEAGPGSGVEVVATADSLRALADELDGEPIDVLVAELHTLHAGATGAIHEEVARCGAQRAILVYGYAATPPLAELRQAGFALMRAPVDPGELRDLLGRMLGTLAAAAAGGGPAEAGMRPPGLSREAISRLAAVLPSVDCECPHHLADLIHSLLAFEQYSVECKVAHPQDADFHTRLQAESERVRSTFEEALLHLVREAGIDFESLAPGSSEA